MRLLTLGSGVRAPRRAMFFLFDFFHDPTTRTPWKRDQKKKDSNQTTQSLFHHNQTIKSPWKRDQKNTNRTIQSFNHSVSFSSQPNTQITLEKGSGEEEHQSNHSISFSSQSNNQITLEKESKEGGQQSRKGSNGRCVFLVCIVVSPQNKTVRKGKGIQHETHQYPP